MLTAISFWKNVQPDIRVVIDVIRDTAIRHGNTIRGCLGSQQPLEASIMGLLTVFSAG